METALALRIPSFCWDRVEHVCRHARAVRLPHFGANSCTQLTLKFVPWGKSGLKSLAESWCHCLSCRKLVISEATFIWHIQFQMENRAQEHRIQYTIQFFLPVPAYKSCLTSMIFTAKQYKEPFFFPFDSLSSASPSFSQSNPFSACSANWEHMCFWMEPGRGLCMAVIWKYHSKFHMLWDNTLARPSEVTPVRGIWIGKESKKLWSY